MHILTKAFSTEAAHLQRSVMRELIGLTAQPDIISLAGGLPASEFLPTDAFRTCVGAVLSREGGDALQYRPRYTPLLEWIAGYMQARGVSCQPEQVFITNGNQQGLTIMSRLFLDPGQVVVTEEIVFTGVHLVTGGRQMAVRTVPTDLTTGIDVDALEATFNILPHPRLAILIPDFHNPLGVSITAEKRARIAALAAEYQIPLVEDDPYSELRFTGEKALPIKAYDEGEFVFYLGSFSKMLAPAARLGWIIAPLELIPRITVLREAIDLESSGFMQRVVAEFLTQGLLDAHLEQLNTANRIRCEAMMAALDTHMRDIAVWTKPEGGLFVWVKLDENVDTWEMFKTAIDQKVAYIPGTAFAIDGGSRNTMRLNFSKGSPEEIHEGVARLTEVIRSQMRS